MTKLVVALRSLANVPKNEAITLRASSNVLKHSDVSGRSLKSIQVLGGLQLLCIRKHLKEVVNWGREIAKWPKIDGELKVYYLGKDS